MHYYYHHIGDFIKDTSFLTNEELGIYMKLIWLYYDSESPLDNNANTLAVKIGARDKVNQVEGILNLFFKLENNKWHQSRCDREIESYKKQADAGKRGAEKRWGSHKGVIATPYPPHSHPNPTPIATNNQEPITNNHSIGAKAPRAKRLDIKELPKDWEEFCKSTRPDLKPNDVFDQFKDYWVAQGGSKGAKLDWLATWRNWVRNQRSTQTNSKEDKSWMMSNQGIEAKAQELGVNSYGVANHQQLKDKILQVMAKRSLE